MDKIFIDTDIILDLIQQREPYYAALGAKLKYLITRNQADYKESGIILCKPENI